MCWSSNSVGEQRQPCIFHIIAAGEKRKTFQWLYSLNMQLYLFYLALYAEHWYLELIAVCVILAQENTLARHAFNWDDRPLFACINHYYYLPSFFVFFVKYIIGHITDHYWKRYCLHISHTFWHVHKNSAGIPCRILVQVHLVLTCPHISGKPEAVQNCSVINESTDSFQVNCLPGFNGGLPQHFSLAVFKVSGGTDGGSGGDPVLASNLSSTMPAFTVSGLEPGSKYIGELTGHNVKGAGVATQIHVYTLKLPEKLIPQIEPGGPSQPGMFNGSQL